MELEENEVCESVLVVDFGCDVDWNAAVYRLEEGIGVAPRPRFEGRGSDGLDVVERDGGLLKRGELGTDCVVWC